MDKLRIFTFQSFQTTYYKLDIKCEIIVIHDRSTSTILK